MEKWKKVWQLYFGDNELGTDAFGNKIKRSEYGNNSSYGWTLDHIWPESEGGSNDYENLQPMSLAANQQKGNLTKGKIKWIVNGKEYSIRWSVTLRKSKDGSNIGDLNIQNSDGKWFIYKNGCGYLLHNGEWWTAKIVDIQLNNGKVEYKFGEWKKLK